MDPVSGQALFDGIASSPFDEIGQSASNPDAIDNALAPGTLGGGSSSFFSAVPTWAWYALGAVIALKVLKVI